MNVIGGCTEKGINFSEERTPGAFSSIRASGPFNVYYCQSDECKVLVEGTEESVPKLLTNVSGGCLEIKLENGRYHDIVLKVTVFGPELEDVKSSGSGSFLADSIAGDDVSIITSGSGSVAVRSIVCSDLTFISSGSGGVRVENASVDGDASLIISGSGSGRLDNFQVNGDMDITISGSGSVIVNGFCDELSATISGSGSISGDFKYDSIHTRTSGSGSVKLK